MTLNVNFAKSLTALTSQYAAAQNTADRVKWNIAKLVNEYYDECGQFHGDQMAYFAECSRVANAGLAVNIFGESGETLRRWCNVQNTYSALPEAEAFLDALSFAHLAAAKKLAGNNKVPAPVYALAKAIDLKLSCDDMVTHFDPPTPPNNYDKFTSAMTTLLDRKTYEWIQSADVVDEILSHARAIETLKSEYLQKKGMAQ